MFEIIKDAPMRVSKRGRQSKYPFADMQVGDAPRDLGLSTSGLDDRRRHAVRSSAYAWGIKQTPHVKFTVWCLDENTVRCRRQS